MDAYGIIRTFGVVVLLVANCLSVQCSQIHERVTEDETANLLHTIRHEMSAVKNSRYKRSNPDLPTELTALGRSISDYMYPSDGQLFGEDTPVWLAFTNPNGTIEYKKMRKGIVGIMVSRLYTGHFPPDSGKEKEESKNETTRRNTEAPNANRTILDADYNVSVNATSVTEEEIRRLESQIREASRSDNTTDASRVKRSDQETIYPSVLVQTDFRGSKTTLNDLDYYKEIVYQLGFWTAVDLRFRQFNNPKIRIRLTGMIIGLDRGVTPYLQDGEAAKIWNETREYWWNMGQREDFPRKSYHIVVTMTDRRFFNNRSFLEGMTAKSLCSWPTNNRLHAVAIVHDNGGFEGTLKATRTLGDFLGLDHDKDSGDECDTSNGFIMQSQHVTGPKNLQWSPCSLKNMSTLMRERMMLCYDKPAEFHPPGRSLRIVLPGNVLGPNKQCQGRGYDWTCDSSPDMCGQMQCYHTKLKALNHGWWCQNTGPAAEGTKCGPEHMCVNGVCQCITDECLFTY